jgi:hypothetical protein
MAIVARLTRASASEPWVPIAPRASSQASVAMRTWRCVVSTASSGAGMPAGTSEYLPTMPPSPGMLSETRL